MHTQQLATSGPLIDGGGWIYVPGRGWLQIPIWRPDFLHGGLAAQFALVGQLLNDYPEQVDVLRRFVRAHAGEWVESKESEALPMLTALFSTALPAMLKDTDCMRALSAMMPAANDAAPKPSHGGQANMMAAVLVGAGVLGLAGLMLLGLAYCLKHGC